jgi:hypothetical protein
MGTIGEAMRTIGEAMRRHQPAKVQNGIPDAKEN